MDSQNLILINGNEYPFEPGETILEVARRNSIDIPTLCHLKGASPSGECGICVVEIDGGSELKSACDTKASSGLAVRTESGRVVESRRETLRELLALGYHNCAVRGSDGKDWTLFQLDVQKADDSPDLCPVWGDCELQDLAYRYNVSGERFPRPDEPYPMETVNPFIVRDFSRCIQCGRCVKACNEVQVNDAIKFEEKEKPLRVITTKGDLALKDSDCVFCGECVQVCPVGALVEKDVRYATRPWETEKVRTTCSYCGVGCQIWLHTKDGKVVKVTGVDTAPNYGSLCVKGRFGFDFIDSPERLTKPLIRKNGELVESGWDEALDLVASKFGEIKAAHGGDKMGLLTSARISNEENYVAQKFVRAVLKTNNVDHCARL